MIYVIDRIPAGELQKNGHYRLQNVWLQSLIQELSTEHIKLSFLSFCYLLIKNLIQHSTFLFPNCSLYDRYSLLDTLLLFLVPHRKKIIVIHSVSKIKFLNYIFCKLVRNANIYVFSKGLQEYMEAFGVSKSTSIILAKYPNADLMKKMHFKDLHITKKVNQFSTDERIGIIWGNHSKETDPNKLLKVLKLDVLDRLIFIGAENAILDDLPQKFPGLIVRFPPLSDEEIVALLSLSSFNLMVFRDGYDFHRSKRAASGVYLTSLAFGIPTLAWFNSESLCDEIALDRASCILDNEHQLRDFAVKVRSGKRAVDYLDREEITLKFIL